MLLIALTPTETKYNLPSHCPNISFIYYIFFSTNSMNPNFLALIVQFKSELVFCTNRCYNILSYSEMKMTFYIKLDNI